MNVHEHCANCILVQCANTKCPVISCKFGCGMKLHECKISDHVLICQNRKLPCVNAYYGCPLTLVRSRLLAHIQYCPASVILCTMEWGRKPLHSEERLKWVPFAQPNPALVKGYLDVEFALHDQKVINKMTQQRCKQGITRKHSVRHNSDMKLSYKRANTFREEMKSNEVRNDEIMNASLVLDELVSVESSSSKEEGLKINELSSEQHSLRYVPDDIPECPSLIDTQSGLGLNLNLEMISKFGRRGFVYTVPCGQILQRREFPAHFRNVHSEIHGGLGWIEQRCPLAHYGCPYAYHRLLPSTQEGSIIFSQDLGVFGVKPVNDSDVMMTSKQSLLLCLPFEVLEDICQWLDGFSLINLSLTCRTLHLQVTNLLQKQGVVVSQWKKRVYEDGSASWSLAEKVWLFTRAFSEVDQWVWSKSPGLAQHFEKCPYFKQHRPVKPYKFVIT